MRQKKRKKRGGEKEKSTVQARTKRTKIKEYICLQCNKCMHQEKKSQLHQAGCVRVSELTSQCVCSDMHQCALRLISMYDLALCVAVLCVTQ